MSEPHDPRDLFGDDVFHPGGAGGGDRGPAPAAATNRSPEIPPAKRMKLVGISRVVAAYEIVLSRVDMQIGREAHNDIAVDHRSVSDFHARVHFDGTDYILEDQGSDQGTRVNSERYRRFVLRQNDLVQVGDVRFRFVRPEDAVIPEAASVSLYVRREPTLTAKHKKLIVLGGILGGGVLLATVAYLLLSVAAPAWMPGFGKGGPSREEALSVQQRLGAAKALFDAGKWAEAEREFAQLEELTRAMSGPEGAQALNYLDRIRRERLAEEKAGIVLALRAEGKADEAHRTLTELLPQLPPDTRGYSRLNALEPALRGEAVAALIERARGALEAGDRPAAAAHVAALLALDPKSEIGRQLKGRLAARGGGGSGGAVEVEYVDAPRDERIGFAFDTGLVDVRKQGAPRSRGQLAQELVERVVASHAAEIRWCYKQALADNPELVGKVSAEWTVTEQGTVSGARIAHSSLHEPGVEACITRKIGRWIFPSPRGGDVVVTYPFAFEPKM